MMEFTEVFPIPQDESNPVTAIRQFPHFQKPDHSWYRCCQCKYPLAPGNATFSFSDYHGEYQWCTHVFLCNPLSWMTSDIDINSPGGKLSCPNCSEHVGEYCWLGLQCMCGEVVSPGLALLSELRDGHIRGAEFRRVRDGSVDDNEVESSQETQSQETNDDVDDVDEEDFDLPQEQMLSETIEHMDDADDEEIPESFGQMLKECLEADGVGEPDAIESNIISDSTDEFTFTPRIQVRPGGAWNTGIVPQDIRVIPRSMVMDYVPPSMRNPHHLPMMPSRLRITWGPPSRSSSAGNSQSSKSSNSSNGNDKDNTVMDYRGETYWASVEVSDPEEIDYQSILDEITNYQYN